MLHMTPEIVEAAYELLRTTPPFKGWKLPEADDIEFHVCRIKGAQADHEYTHGRHVLRINALKHATLASLLSTLAHEMIHIREVNLRLRLDVAHGKAFHRMADSVCRHHGFDRGQF